MFNRNMTPEEWADSIRNRPEIVYVKLITDERGRPRFTDTCFILEWGIKNYGFGTFTFSLSGMGNGLYCGDECTPTAIILKVVEKFCVDNAFENWPTLLKQYGSAKNLVDSVTMWESPRAVGDCDELC